MSVQLTARTRQVFASYRGLMTQGASFPCAHCLATGHVGVEMIYQGVEDVSQVEGVEAKDTLDTLPYDVWTCAKGHAFYDGY